MTANRHIRGKLSAAAWLFVSYLLAALVLRAGVVAPDVQQQIVAWRPLLLTLGLIIAFVALALNPWRADRLPDRFPNIVQDTIVIALFAVTATVLLGERFLATSAVGAVVIGFALQDTLGNLFAGLAIQIEKPFRVGNWVSIGGRDGVVSEVTWRATKIRTRAGNFLVVPNSVLARDAIMNYSEPTPATRVEVDVGASYDTPPNEVKAAILEALVDEPSVEGQRPEVLVADFAASSITYRIQVWTDDFAGADRVKDRVRSRVYYAFRRRGIDIPYPVVMQMNLPAKGQSDDTARLAELLAEVSIFATLSQAQRAELTGCARLRLYAAGDRVVREGEPGSSMFVVAAGEAVVTIAGSTAELARLGPGAFFGEMSLLTGDSRTATVTAAVDCELAEITGDGFRRVVLADPTVVERIGLSVATRRAEMERHRESAAASAQASDTDSTFMSRVRRYLRLSTSA